MPRTKNSADSRARRKKILKKAKGFRQGRSKLYKRAKEFLEKGLTYAYRDRRVKKREFRKLWISKISAACKSNGISYSKFMNGLRKSEINLNRKILSEIAFHQPEVFSSLVEEVRAKEVK